MLKLKAPIDNYEIPSILVGLSDSRRYRSYQEGNNTRECVLTQSDLFVHRHEFQMLLSYPRERTPEKEIDWPEANYKGRLRGKTEI